MGIKVIANGASGNMGQHVVAAVSNESDLQLVAQCDHQDDLVEAINTHQADVVVDFTAASCGFDNTKKIIQAGAHPVIGTTGITQAQVKELQKVCAEKKLGGLIAPNFAIGAVLMMKYAEDAAKYLPFVEIIEFHHDGKQDAPSGTAISTAEKITSTRAKADFKTQSKELIKGARGAIHHDIPIHSVRLRGVIANQEVLFGGEGQTLTIRHDTIDRSAFMPGVILGIREVMQLNELIYGLEGIL